MSFQQGLSGLNAITKDLEVIGNNVANASTYGAKASRAEFADMYASAMYGTGTNTSQIGIGTDLTTVSQSFSQGSIVTTQNPLDLAINGSGFFQISDGGPIQYSRNGQFKVARDGYVVTNQGLKLMGYPADASGKVLPGTAGPLKLPTAGITPSPTSTMKLELNLDSRVKATTLTYTAPATGPAIDFTNPASYNNATALTVYDSRGQEVALNYYFQKTATDQWNVYLTANGSPVSKDATTGYPLPSTTMTFPTNGSAPTSPSGLVSIDIPATTTGAGVQTQPIAGIKLDVTGATEFASGFAVTDIAQNGYAPGQLTGIQFETNGVITARYSNGQTKPAGQVEIATFRNTQGLRPAGGNAWSRSATSGDPITGVPGEGSLGVLQSGALEESNIDLTAELVSMMTAQRVYQADAQTIKTQDQVLQTLVNLR
jgi:flagellar hook protein FlgE